MKFTQYCLHNRHRADRREIRDDWIEQVVRNPMHEAVQADGRVRRWGRIQEAGGRILRVVLLADKETVHNAFFDRRFKDRGHES